MRTSFRPTEILQSVAVQTSIDVTEYVHGYVGVGPSTVCLGSVNGRILHVVWQCGHLLHPWQCELCPSTSCA